MSGILKIKICQGSGTLRYRLDVVSAVVVVTKKLTHRPRIGATGNVAAAVMSRHFAIGSVGSARGHRARGMLLAG